MMLTKTNPFDMNVVFLHVNTEAIVDMFSKLNSILLLEIYSMF